jgi:hypothetical protein
LLTITALLGIAVNAQGIAEVTRDLAVTFGLFRSIETEEKKRQKHKQDFVPGEGLQFSKSVEPESMPKGMPVDITAKIQNYLVNCCPQDHPISIWLAGADVFTECQNAWALVQKQFVNLKTQGRMTPASTGVYVKTRRYSFNLHGRAAEDITIILTAAEEKASTAFLDARNKEVKPVTKVVDDEIELQEDPVELKQQLQTVEDACDLTGIEKDEAVGVIARVALAVRYSWKIAKAYIEKHPTTCVMGLGVALGACIGVIIAIIDHKYNLVQDTHKFVTQGLESRLPVVLGGKRRRPSRFLVVTTKEGKLTLAFFFPTQAIAFQKGKRLPGTYVLLAATPDSEGFQIMDWRAIKAKKFAACFVARLKTPLESIQESRIQTRRATRKKRDISESETPPITDDSQFSDASEVSSLRELADDYEWAERHFDNEADAYSDHYSNNFSEDDENEPSDEEAELIAEDKYVRWRNAFFESIKEESLRTSDPSLKNKTVPTQGTVPDEEIAAKPLTPSSILSCTKNTPVLESKFPELDDLSSPGGFVDQKAFDLWTAEWFNLANINARNEKESSNSTSALDDWAKKDQTDPAVSEEKKQEIKLNHLVNEAGNGSEKAQEKINKILDQKELDSALEKIKAEEAKVVLDKKQVTFTKPVVTQPTQNKKKEPKVHVNQPPKPDSKRTQKKLAAAKRVMEKQEVVIKEEPKIAQPSAAQVKPVFVSMQSVNSESKFPENPSINVTKIQKALVPLYSSADTFIANGVCLANHMVTVKHANNGAGIFYRKGTKEEYVLTQLKITIPEKDLTTDLECYHKPHGYDSLGLMQGDFYHSKAYCFSYIPRQDKSLDLCFASTDLIGSWRNDNSMGTHYASTVDGCSGSPIIVGDSVVGIHRIGDPEVGNGYIKLTHSVNQAIKGNLKSQPGW